MNDYKIGDLVYHNNSQWQVDDGLLELKATDCPVFTYSWPKEVTRDNPGVTKKVSLF